MRTQTLVKNAIIQVDATPFKQFYQQHYGLEVGVKKKSAAATAAAAEAKAAEEKMGEEAEVCTGLGQGGCACAGGRSAGCGGRTALSPAVQLLLGSHLLCSCCLALG